MASILFWNLNNKKLIPELVALCNEHDVDILILAECEFAETELQSAINTDPTRSIFLSPFNPSSRLKFLIRYPLESLEIVSDSPYLAIRRVIPPVGLDFLLAAAHLPSKLYMTPEEQTMAAPRLMKAILDAENKAGHERTLIIGDLNMNPFENGMVGSDGLHAVMDKSIALKKSRVVQNEVRKFFYNPMWGRMGDTSKGPPGTYYKNMSGYINLFWNTFDQALLRPDLLKFFTDDDLAVITEINGNSMLTNNRINNLFSDHLPLLLKLNIEEEVFV